MSRELVPNAFSQFRGALHEGKLISDYQLLPTGANQEQRTINSNIYVALSKGDEGMVELKRQLHSSIPPALMDLRKTFFRNA